MESIILYFVLGITTLQILVFLMTVLIAVIRVAWCINSAIRLDNINRMINSFTTEKSDNIDDNTTINKDTEIK